MDDRSVALLVRALSGPCSRRKALLAVGGGAALAIGAARPAAAETVTGWRFCSKCRGLFKARGTKPGGVCPAGGKHQPLKAINYVLLADPPVSDPNLSATWFRCIFCAALFRHAFGDGGVCPKNATGHLPGSSPRYSLWQGAPVAGMMDAAWDECSKCKGLFNWASGNVGVCPDGGGHARLDPGTSLSLFFLD